MRRALVEILLQGSASELGFYLSARRALYAQRAVWRQHVVLHRRSRIVGGAAMKTDFLREQLLRLSQEANEAAADRTAEDEALLALPEQEAICLLSPRDGRGQRLPVSLPVDPTAAFCGTVVEESEVLASKQAPMMLVCRILKPPETQDAATTL